MLKERKIDRFIFNFRNQCNMKCGFCYIPFVDDHAGNIDTWCEVIDFMKLYSPKVITLGGGDPFFNVNFPLLLEYAGRTSNAELHVDTNGINLDENVYKVICQYVSVLGLPLEGSSEIHNKLRRHPKHYEIVLRHLNALNNLKDIKLKINTVITKDNYKCIKELAYILSSYNIHQWYIYEYWHFPGINPIEYKLTISEEREFLSLLDSVKHIVGFKTIYSTVNNRKNSYIFISSIGRVYLIKNGDEYIELGTIYDEHIHDSIETYINRSSISLRAREKNE